MTRRFLEIITSDLIVRKQKLEQELEETINETNNKVDERVDKVINLLYRINEVSNALLTFDTYINKPNEQTNGTD